MVIRFRSVRALLRGALLPSLACLGLMGAARAADPVSEAPNWCAQAERSLVDANGQPVRCQSVARRCVRMNNYWCQKHGGSPWRGTPDADGRDGARDVDGHAVFTAVSWSARAMALDLKSKVMRRGLRSAMDIAAAHSPWCDTLGSKAVVQGRGRTCPDGRARPPAGFDGPRCAAPAGPAPQRSDCQPGCNCPPEIAETLVRGTGLDPNADLGLFDAQGRPQPVLATVLRNLAWQEQGIRVRPEVIEDGLALLR